MEQVEPAGPLPEAWQAYFDRRATGHLVETKQQIVDGRPRQIFWSECLCGWKSAWLWHRRSDAWHLDAMLHRIWYAQTARPQQS